MRRTPMTDIIHQYIGGSWTDAADANVGDIAARETADEAKLQPAAAL
jgi:hypothetical protein